MNHRKSFLAEQTYATLFSLTNKLQVRGDQYLGQLTSRQLMAMIAVAHLPDDQRTLNNIARKLGTTKQSVKQLIAIIEKKGYVVTAPSRRDKRAVNVTLTEAGVQVALECGEKGIRFFDELFKEFTTGEMEVLWNMLKRLYRFDGEEQDGFEAQIPITEGISGGPQRSRPRQRVKP